MSVSVVIPAHNAGDHLAATIRSVIRQTVPDWELVVVDDGSRDGTAEIARAFAAQDPRVTVVQQSNAGMAHARNRGLAETSVANDYTALLDHDDLWHADALATLLESLRRNPGATGAYGLARYVDGQARPFAYGQMEAWCRDRTGIADGRLMPWPQHRATTFSVLAYSNCIPTMGALLFRRSALPGPGPFDPAAVPCDDWDFYLQLSRSGEIAFVDRLVIDWRWHSANATRDRRLASAQQDYVRRKLLLNPSLTPEQHAIVRTAIRLWRRSRRSKHLLMARVDLQQRRLVRGFAGLARAVTVGGPGSARR